MSNLNNGLDIDREIDPPEDSFDLGGVAALDYESDEPLGYDCRDDLRTRFMLYDYPQELRRKLYREMDELAMGAKRADIGERLIVIFEEWIDSSNDVFEAGRVTTITADMYDENDPEENR